MNKYLILIGLLFIVSGDQSLSIIYISITNSHYEIDKKNKLIVSHLAPNGKYNDFSSYQDVVVYLGSTKLNFSEKPEKLNYTSSYKVNIDEESYALYFTSLPIISINTTTEIKDEPKSPAVLTYTDYKKIIKSNIGIEIRGGSSQAFPKKTYDIEFWKSTSGEMSQNVQLGNLRDDDDWILDALYNEPLRLRSNYAHMLWLKLGESHTNEDFKGVALGARVEYVEIFINGTYNGIYNLSEQVDRKQLGIEKYEINEVSYGELYQGIDHGDATNFKGVPEYTDTLRYWSGHELKYPKTGQITNWEALYGFTDFVVNSSNEEFTNQVCDRFQCENLVDYFIFINVLRATDNSGKNAFITRSTENDSYFYVPWDLDAIFGCTTSGKNFYETKGIVSNGLMSRSRALNPDDHTIKLLSRWKMLRRDILSTENVLKDIQQRYNFLSENKIYEREKIVFLNYPFDEESLNFIIQWTEERLNFLDDYFDSLRVRFSHLYNKTS